jgi:hypothetical protein
LKAPVETPAPPPTAPPPEPEKKEGFEDFEEAFKDLDLEKPSAEKATDTIAAPETVTAPETAAAPEEKPSTGMELDEAGLWQIFRRNRNLVRALNVRRGMRRKDEKNNRSHS